jgi:glycosyltransferase 2 family protein
MEVVEGGGGANEVLQRRRPVVTTTRRGRARVIIGGGVSLVAVAGCVWWASRQETPTIPSGLGNWGLLGIGLLLYAGATVARGWRWDRILRSTHLRHSSADAYALIPVGYMGNTILPARGGELLRIFLLSERSAALKREVLGSILPERLLDAAAIGLLFAGLTLARVAGAPTGLWPAVVALCVVVAAVIAAVAYLRLRIAGHLQSFADRVRPVAKASRLLLTREGAALALTTVGVWLSEGVIFWLVAQALGARMTVPEAVFVTVLAGLAALVPSGPGYVGTYDGAALFALHALDVTGGDAIGIVILFRFIVFVPITLVGLVLMIVRYGGLREALRTHRAAKPLAAGA